MSIIDDINDYSENGVEWDKESRVIKVDLTDSVQSIMIFIEVYPGVRLSVIEKQTIFKLLIEEDDPYILYYDPDSVILEALNIELNDILIKSINIAYLPEWTNQIRRLANIGPYSLIRVISWISDFNYICYLNELE